ncbi:SDR family oxidoreductase [Salinirubellus salinus]|jgi:hypothetical protein|uniref:SDR family oxidoreductase n=1 Tax=Salinirubellus salinus TaxID=1364945 RepID=A0A9E7UA95_9EURY|nr:SDR family oxidoreductase [Salinirubellus salinus]UWM56761.1 SDR family oxidoreductase [Salinirubellus salinus]
MSHGTVLVTGASAGIGRALTDQFAANGWDPVLVARREERLASACEELEAAFGVDADYVVQDLAVDGACDALYGTVTEELGREVDILVNNVGVGTQGEYVDVEAERDLQQLQLNVVVPSHLAKLFGRDMKQRGDGYVLNVASSAAFQPGPYMAVYYASKAYLLSFSEALHEELKPHGVTVTALCPGPVETEFQERAENTDTPIGGGRGGFVSFQQADEVAEAGYDGLMDGKAVVIPGLDYKLLAKLTGVLPRSVTRRLAAQLNH